MVSAAGCGTSAQGVDDCRDIETARCAAAKNCGMLVSDVASCQRFYRDQCLHGLAVASPGAVKVKACVTTIRAAGECAALSSDGETPLSECASVSADAPGVKTACDLVKEPERAAECQFLLPGAGGSGSGGTASTDEAGAGGA